MDKFSDGFSNKSYDDLLDEYAGESLVSKVNKHHEQVKEQERAKKSEVKAAPTPPVKQPTKPVIETPTKRSVPKEQPVKRTVRKAQSTNVDLREIKSFDEEMAEKKLPTPKKSEPKLTDTMEFKKGALPKKKKPTIQKMNSAGGKKESKLSKKLPKNVQKAVSKMPKPKTKLSGKDIMNAIKTNQTIFAGFVLCLVVSVFISMIVISCVNDVLAIGRDSETAVEVNLPNDADTSDAIKALKDAGLIKNKLFCNIFIKAMGYKDDNYLPGVYYFTEDMGVEKMIKRFKTSSTRGALISITIPEGFTIDKIFERLEKNNICTASALYKTVDEVDFSSEYDFIAPIKNKEDRYHVLEGYFFPATYEFEQGADPATVVRKFLDTFKSHWTEEYAKQAKELGMSTDEVIILASIIEKEGANAEQFPLVSSVLHNRLNRSGLYPLLELNSTKDYVTNTIASRVTSKAALNNYILNYNTYEKEGLSVGAICNPGEDAIKAALFPDNTQYYFFAHDNKRKIYLAETMEQHDQNRRQIAQVNSSLDS